MSMKYLYQIEIIAGKSFISYQITDERLNNDVCGITTHLFEQVDTTDIFNEWQNYLDFKRMSPMLVMLILWMNFNQS